MSHAAYRTRASPGLLCVASSTNTSKLDLVRLGTAAYASRPSGKVHKVFDGVYIGGRLDSLDPELCDLAVLIVREYSQPGA